MQSNMNNQRGKARGLKEAYTCLTPGGPLGRSASQDWVRTLQIRADLHPLAGSLVMHVQSLKSAVNPRMSLHHLDAYGTFLEQCSV